ncbi:MAG: peroxide stress protein YaaA [Flavobacteriaceae bacterium]
MKILLSPAKSLDFERTVPNFTFEQPEFMLQSERIMKVLVKKNPKKLKDLMGISEKLAELNWQRNQDWYVDFSQKESRPAVFAFTGDVYQGLDVDQLSEQDLEYLQLNLMILSGLYGILKPFDFILPYRLEMGTKLKVGTRKNLYELWKPILTKYVKSACDSQEDFILNLASTEYSKAVDLKKMNVPVINAQFKDYKNGQLKMISFFAKKARGLMLRYCANNKITTIEQLKGFDLDGYAFDSNLSDENNLIFTR